MLYIFAAARVSGNVSIKWQYQILQIDPKTRGLMPKKSKTYGAARINIEISCVAQTGRKYPNG
jgi:hypothetical protein